ncbi:type II toxin-antitoxin system HipA family toxin [Mesorhizobium sp. M1C.F.Ca.ET.193.01.1.1]|uniref:type II toxin-antitoxin system HipA family toxin n=1 Tax=unclassified Mesorhizobium TaxID=325217 RepID=UPI000FD3791A|nr:MULTISPECIES: HipA domain-containing protein [unclassified Mesorhizobium]TGS92298.1 type II toxin-antitoxin system HipA family toxin [bacterium M00.F.Ca.ET.177.01.1.1]TGQ50192.1 type II toxin-antitoxin system HipA family toxin [Mesorhizobium sp. M1C.F.Ca.ET.210.01.1.1]TGQ64881.1 type II toxin-antitoxin system HipA family toxin [Mesorhizobium sp. M1C.F.Ca.ET.212.01.1.1]TGQ98662.1 type II toxin-antitoxin system HipA family toxin [Mesorhizobium sp. M1C.F.Ca.ET.204.01.1.1]TGR18899.1 type II tox
MADFEVHIDLGGRTRPVGLARTNRNRGTETILFEYDDAWLKDSDRFFLEPALALTRGAFAPPAGASMFGSIGDSAPDTWGRRLMQRSERRLAERERRAVRTLMESDYLLGVADETRLGALRFRTVGAHVYQAPTHDSVPAFIELGRLLEITERILRDEESDEDLRLIFAPGSSLGGARPKASVIDQHGRLAIAKFPKETDDYSIETWEEIALRLAGQAGIATPHHELIKVAGKPVMLSRRFDRDDGYRIPFLSAMAMMGARDGEHGSYPEMVDALAQHGAQGKTDAQALYRRVVFNVLISNVDDHLRNHGFLWLGKAGWSLSPAYDLNPVPTDLKPRVLTTKIDLDEGTCSLDLLEAASEFFALTLDQARTIIKEVATVTATWRDTAKAVGARPAEISRMASAFEHDDLKRALL